MTADAPTTGRPAGGPRSATARGRRRSREFAVQGLYQWLLSRDEPAAVDAHIRETVDFAKCDAEHFDALLRGCIGEAEALDAMLGAHTDRPTAQLSPVEHAVLMVGTYELKHCVDIPYRVAINEAVEVAKAFGGTDGHKYVNGVLDKAAAQLRPEEVRAAREARGRT